MNKQYTIKASTSEMGGSCHYIECPFCGCEVKAYIWSLAGCGKRCPCGAKHTWMYGTVPPAEKGSAKQKPLTHNMGSFYTKNLVTLRHGMYLCRPEKRKVVSSYPKWYCTICKRYVLPDRVHPPVFAPDRTREELINSLQQSLPTALGVPGLADGK